MVQYNYEQIDDIEIFYRESGNPTDPTILLLHGFPSSSHMFRDFIPRLEDKFHLIAPDYPGFGHSDCPPPDEFNYSFKTITSIMESFVDKQDFDSFSPFMMDYGGPVGFRLAKKHPDWIESLLIQNANAYEEGITDKFRNLIGPLWDNRNGESEKTVLDLFTREGTKFQYTEGTRNPGDLNPDAWIMDLQNFSTEEKRLLQLDL